MHSRSVAGGRDEPGEGRDQCLALLRAEGAEQGLLLFVGEAVAGRQHLSGGGSQVDGVGAAVVGVSPALDEASALEVVDQTHHRIPVQAEGGGQLLLRAAFLPGEVGKHPEAVRGDAERGERGREALCALEAELREQEAGARLEGGHIRTGHLDIVPIGDCTLM